MDFAANRCGMDIGLPSRQSKLKIISLEHCASVGSTKGADMNKWPAAYMVSDRKGHQNIAADSQWSWKAVNLGDSNPRGHESSVYESSESRDLVGPSLQTQYEHLHADASYCGFCPS